MQNTAKEAFSLKAKEILDPYRIRFEKSLPQAFERFGPENKVKEAMVYALSSEGKRFRPALVYMVADALNPSINVTNAALTVEYFHTSSLIADDLPCMDNDDFRRGRPTSHKAYGEAVALLASYALISSGFDEIALNEGSAEISRMAIRLASQTMGNAGLIGGQFYDLFPSVLDRAECIKIIDMKTSALFDLSMSLGWVFAGGSTEKLSHLHEAALHFGIMFQIIDDLDDMEKDKATNKVNFANCFGLSSAIDTVLNSQQHFEAAIQKLGLRSEPLTLLVKGLGYLAQSYQ